MPTFEKVEVSTEIDVDFEVFCGECGKGLCSESDTRRSRGRGWLQVTVNPCPDCIALKNEEIESLGKKIEELEEELSKYK